ncbi:MAG: hypothetical protein HY235_28600 [Acidobacteria bacterium]|nr:hypothetical protein [Acidobacteriota bacterium]
MYASGAVGALCLLAVSAFSQAVCECNPADPATLEARQCSLCTEAEKQVSRGVFFLKDSSPRKPNRWLALPSGHLPGQHHLHELSAHERTALWTAAIAKAKELWGEEWGLAYNGPKVRTQCHTHIHMGKLLRMVETRNFITVSGPAQIPAPENEGIWVHPAGNKLHVHLGEQTTETVLMR